MNRIRIEVDDHDELPVVVLTGDIDVVNHELVQAQLARIALEVGPALVTDFNDVHYIDSNGVRTLFSLARGFEQSRIDWVVVLGDDSPLQRLFKVTAFDEVVKIEASRTSAISALRNGA